MARTSQKSNSKKSTPKGSKSYNSTKLEDLVRLAVLRKIGIKDELEKLPKDDIIFELMNWFVITPSSVIHLSGTNKS